MKSLKFENSGGLQLNKDAGKELNKKLIQTMKKWNNWPVEQRNT